MRRDLAPTLAWLAVIAGCLHWGRALAPWIEGTGRWLVTAGLIAAGAGGLAVAGLLLARLPKGRRAMATVAILASATGMAILAWAQPAFIERTHLLLYGVLGVLVLRVVQRIAYGGRALFWTVAVCAGLGAADELAQHFHPQRVGAAIDAATNAASALLAAWPAWVILPTPPETSAARQPLKAAPAIAVLVACGLPWAVLLCLAG